MRNSKGQFIKGETSPRKGVKLSILTKKKIGISSKKIWDNPDYKTKMKKLHTGLQAKENHPLWQGDDAGYFAVHIWLKKYFSKANHCENRDNGILSFSCTNKSKNYQWANKKESKYTRYKKDYYQLCISCHKRYDLGIIKEKNLVGIRNG
jgi:hypothetical protein